MPMHLYLSQEQFDKVPMGMKDLVKQYGQVKDINQIPEAYRLEDIEFALFKFLLDFFGYPVRLLDLTRLIQKEFKIELRTDHLAKLQRLGIVKIDPKGTVTLPGLCLPVLPQKEADPISEPNILAAQIKLKSIKQKLAEIKRIRILLLPSKTNALRDKQKTLIRNIAKKYATDSTVRSYLPNLDTSKKEAAEIAKMENQGQLKEARQFKHRITDRKGRATGILGVHLYSLETERLQKELSILTAYASQSLGFKHPQPSTNFQNSPQLLDSEDHDNEASEKKPTSEEDESDGLRRRRPKRRLRRISDSPDLPPMTAAIAAASALSPMEDEPTPPIVAGSAATTAPSAVTLNKEMPDVQQAAAVASSTAKIMQQASIPPSAAKKMVEEVEEDETLLSYLLAKKEDSDQEDPSPRSYLRGGFGMSLSYGK